MIAKFKCKENKSLFVELGILVDDRGRFAINIENELGEFMNVQLDQQDLFELIGYLLSIQSKMKKELNNE